MLCLQVDILHPLATLEWKQCGKVPKELRGNTPFDDLIKCVTLGEKIYMSSDTRICVSTDLNSWTELPELPASHGTLTTYRSQLVLVGGVNSLDLTTTTNKLWSLSEAGVWQESLPQMHAERCQPGVASATDPECLIVIGEKQFDSAGGDDSLTIEILIGDQWFVARHLPNVSLEGGVAHNGMLYVHGRSSHTYKQCNYIFSCDLRSLIASCRHPAAHNPLKWSKMGEIRDPIVNMLLFRQQLVVVCEKTIHAYHPVMDVWPCILVIGRYLYDVEAVKSSAILTGDLLAVQKSKLATWQIMRMSLKSKCVYIGVL